jgi:hypothetical protein
MTYYLYSSVDNIFGIDEYISFFEVGDDGYHVRYIEIKPNGTVIKYNQVHAADKFGQLPEGKLNDQRSEIFDNRYGTTVTITKELFDSVWANIFCVNLAK